MDDIRTESDVSVIPTREELLQRARDMVPQLKERTPKCEALRRAPDETIRAFHDAGFFKIGLPRKFGGYELDYDVLCEVIMEVAHGCGASAWNLAVLGEHNYTLVNCNAKTLEELWGENPETLISSGNDPKAVLTEVEGGYLFNGRLKFSSGCDHASWWLSGAPVKDKPGKLGILLHGDDATIIDEWHVTGLAGTGSKDVEFKDAFIPYHRIRTMGGPEWGGRAAEVQNSATYKLSQMSTKPFTLASVSIGIAGGVIKDFTESMTSRMSRFGNQIADYQSLQLRIAESAAEYEAARKIVLGDLRESIEILREEEDIPEAMHFRNRRDMGYCPRLAQSAVDRLFYAAGAGGLFTANNLQRQFRDVHAAGAQLFLNWDINGTAYGRHRLGLELEGPRMP